MNIIMTALKASGKKLAESTRHKAHSQFSGKQLFQFPVPISGTVFYHM